MDSGNVIKEAIALNSATAPKTERRLIAMKTDLPAGEDVMALDLCNRIHGKVLVGPKETDRHKFKDKESFLQALEVRPYAMQPVKYWNDHTIAGLMERNSKRVAPELGSVRKLPKFRVTSYVFFACEHCEKVYMYHRDWWNHKTEGGDSPLNCDKHGTPLQPRSIEYSVFGERPALFNEEREADFFWDAWQDEPYDAEIVPHIWGVVDEAAVASDWVPELPKAEEIDKRIRAAHPGLAITGIGDVYRSERAVQAVIAQVYPGWVTGWIDTDKDHALDLEYPVDMRVFVGPRRPPRKKFRGIAV